LGGRIPGAGAPRSTDSVTRLARAAPRACLVRQTPVVASATARPQSAIEETLQRIERASNVTGFVILDSSGNVLRYRTDMGEELARLIAMRFQPLLERCLSAVRDMDPTVRAPAVR